MLRSTDEAAYIIAKTYSTAFRALQTSGGPYWKLTELGFTTHIVEPNVQESSAQLQTADSILASLDYAVNEADISCVLGKHSVFVMAVDEIQLHNAIDDAVGSLR